MDAAPLVRLRWRLRGAWLWPSFFVLSAADAVIIHELPPSGDSADLVGAWLTGSILSLVAVAVFSGPLGGLVRRVRPDMPRVVARNYAGALVTLAITLVFLGAGLANHQTIVADNQALRDATARAEAYIGAHAPPAFQRRLTALDTVIVQPRLLYRVCASDPASGRYYCVVVNRSQPFGRSVHYSGSESNGLLAEGTGP